MRQIISKLSVAALAMTFAAACSQAKWHETEKKVTVGPLNADPNAQRLASPTPSPTPVATPVDAKVDPKNPKATPAPTGPCGRRIQTGTPCQDAPPAEEPKTPETPVKTGGGSKVPAAPMPEPDPEEQDPSGLRADKYFVVENIATEKLRLYERLSDCENRLILETDMTVGLDAPGLRTKPGTYTIAQWVKFAEDARQAAWYSPEYPRLPGPGSDVISWTAKSLLPHGGHGVRGTSGWYSAELQPNAEQQDLQGSLGWGVDGDRFIEDLRRAPLDHNPKIASRGGSHVENRAIAMMREILVSGSRVIRVYSRESLIAPNARRAKQGHWDYILTTENGPHAPRSGHSAVVQRRTPRDLYLETGRYRFKAYATAIPLGKHESPHRNGNVYHVPEAEMIGTFFVDEGRLSDDYQTPKSLEVGGQEDGYLPSSALASHRCQAAPPLPPPRPATPPATIPESQPEPLPTLPEPTPVPVRPAHHMD